MEKPTLEQLKAIAYDCLIQVQNWQAKLQQVNEQIQNYPPVVKSPEEKVELETKEENNG